MSLLCGFEKLKGYSKDQVFIRLDPSHICVEHKA